MADKPDRYPDTLSRVLATLHRLEARQQIIEARLEAIDATVTEIAGSLMVDTLGGDRTERLADG